MKEEKGNQDKSYRAVFCWEPHQTRMEYRITQLCVLQSDHTCRITWRQHTIRTVYQASAF